MCFGAHEMQYMSMPGGRGPTVCISLSVMLVDVGFVFDFCYFCQLVFACVTGLS